MEILQTAESEPFAGLDEKIKAMEKLRGKIRKSKEMVGMYKRVNAAEQFVSENISVIKEKVDENMTGLEHIQDKVRHHHAITQIFFTNIPKASQEASDDRFLSKAFSNFQLVEIRRMPNANINFKRFI